MSVGTNSRRATLYKTATWYLSDSVMTGVVSYVVTRDVKTAIGIAGLQQTCELAWYYMHERIWIRTKNRPELGVINYDGHLSHGSE